MSVVLGGAGDLSCSEISLIGKRSLGVELDPDALVRAAASHALAVDIAARRPIYGRSTGVGSNKDVTVVDPAAAAQALLRSHATSAGAPRSPERVRAMLAVRIHQLGQGGSGVNPVVVEALAAMLRDDALPAVLEYGSIGTGDLAALATTALALQSTSRTRSAVVFGAHDALAFLSSSAASLADAALATADLQKLADTAVLIAGLSWAALRGNPEAFSIAVESATPFPGARSICRTMRSIIDPGGVPARIQDPYGLRTLPQVHGVTIDSLAHSASIVTALISAPSENPVFTPPDSVAHQGGFQMSYLATALDTARSSLAQSAQLVKARLSALLDPELTGLPAFLGDGTPGASGLLAIEYVAASALAELRALALPVAMQSVTLSHGAEEDASFASLGAEQSLNSVGPYRVLLGC
jgi:histidine ammonia-lyase